MIVSNDWMPMLGGVLLLTLLGLAGLSSLPLLLSDHPGWQRLQPWLWLVTGSVSAVVAIKWVSDGVKEYRLMMRAISLDPDATTSEMKNQQPNATPTQHSGTNPLI